MKVTGKTFWLAAIASFVIGMGIIWILEDPYVKSQYYETDVTVTVELQWPADAEYGKIQTKLVYNRPFAFVFEHKLRDGRWSHWSPIYLYTNYTTRELIYVDSTTTHLHDVERPATFIVWVRYYDDIVENYNGVELERSAILDTVRYEYPIIPMSK